MIILEIGGEDHERFAEVNRRILSVAEEQASAAGPAADPRSMLLAVVVWDGEPRGEDDLSAAFAREARKRKIRYHEVSTRAASYSDRLAPGGRKKMFALEGGGILGLLSIGYLIRIEDELRKRLNGGEDFVLADYFDYVAGTSTGSVIATCVALGMPAREIQRFYVENGKALCQKRWAVQRWYSKFNVTGFEKLIKRVFGEESTLGSPRLRTGLMVVLRNATTDSPWPLSNQPGAKYNDPARPDCNLDLPLWQLVRGSTAAPTYYDPEVIVIGPRKFVFVDGGVTAYNNPSFHLFAMATVDSYGLMWPADEDRLLLVSIGTGICPDANENLGPGQMNLRYNATRIPSALIAAASAQQDFVCRMYGRCVHGAPIDQEIGHMLSPLGVGPLGPEAKKQFRYARYNVDLTQEGLRALGFKESEVRSEDVIAIDSVAHIDDLVEIGARAAGRDVHIGHFDGFL
ncbi:MAG TPA: patatin-like phospholipase family protein [Isosphaeraceae bacterium]